MTKNDTVYKLINLNLNNVNENLARATQERDTLKIQLFNADKYVNRLSDQYDSLKEWIDEYDSDS